MQVIIIINLHQGFAIYLLSIYLLYSLLSELNCLYNIFYDVNYIVDFSKLYLCTSYCLINLDLKQSIIYLCFETCLFVYIVIVLVFLCISFRWCNVIQVFCLCCTSSIFCLVMILFAIFDMILFVIFDGK